MPTRSVRYRRLMGDDVRFQTGMDEHSANIEKTGQRRRRSAARSRRSVGGQLARGVRQVRDLATTDSSAPPTRTTRGRPSRWSQRAMDAGDIYKGTYSGWYCPGDNEFKTEAQIVDGHCPEHPNLELQWLEEENWFFALQQVPGAGSRRCIATTRPSASPSTSATRSWAGCAKVCVTSRSAAPARTGASRFPTDPKHRIYVWFDALTNYITGVGFPDDHGRVREVVAGRRARHRQEHHPLPLPVLAGDADERRPAAAAPGLRPRLHARQGRQDEQDAGQRARS